MADEHLLLLLWTALAVIFALFYFWRQRKLQQRQKFIEEQKRTHDEVVSKARIERLRNTKTDKATFGGGSETESSIAEASRETGSDRGLGSYLPKVSSEKKGDKSVRRKYIRSEEDIKEARLKKFEEEGKPDERNNQTDDHDDSAEIGNKVPVADSLVQSDQSHANESESSLNIVEELIDGNNKNVELSTLKRIPAPGKPVTAGGDKTVFDPESGAPVAHPLKTLEEALAWRPGFDEFNIAREPLVVSKALPVCGSQVKTLVCHDMRGGYIEDR